MKIIAGESEQMLFEPIERKNDLCGFVARKWTKKKSFYMVWLINEEVVAQRKQMGHAMLKSDKEQYGSRIYSHTVERMFQFFLVIQKVRQYACYFNKGLMG